MDNPPTEEDIFGWLGGILQLFYNIPQIYKIYKTKKTEDISIISWLLRFISYIFYIIHIWRIQDAALFYTYILGFIQVFIITAQVVLYKSKCKNNNATAEQTDFTPRKSRGTCTRQDFKSV